MDGWVLNAIKGRQCEDGPDSLQAGREWTYFDSPVPPASELMSRHLEVQYDSETAVEREENYNLITEDHEIMKRLMFN